MVGFIPLTCVVHIIVGGREEEEGEEEEEEADLVVHGASEFQCKVRTHHHMSQNKERFRCLLKLAARW